MKKNVFLLLVCICCANVSFAQIKADSNEKIGIGTSSPNASYKTTIVQVQAQIDSIKFVGTTADSLVFVAYLDKY